MGKIEAHHLVANFAELVAAMRDPAHIWPAMLQQLVDAAHAGIFGNRGHEGEGG